MYKNKSIYLTRKKIYNRKRTKKRSGGGALDNLSNFSLANTIAQQLLPQLQEHLGQSPAQSPAQSTAQPTVQQYAPVAAAPTQKDIMELIKTLFHESWFQDQLLDILSRNLKTQYFNKTFEIVIFNIFNNILDNINKNDNIILTISLLKNNIPYFEELFKNSIDLHKHFYENERFYRTDDNVGRVTEKTSTTLSRVIAKNFREMLSPKFKEIVDESIKKNIDTQTQEKYEYLKGKYLYDIENEKKAAEEEEKKLKEQRRKDREESYKKIIAQNTEARLSNDLNEEAQKKLLEFLNNIDESTNETQDGAILIDGEHYNKMIVQVICDSIQDMLKKPDSIKELIRVILLRFDYMLKDFIGVMQNNGIIKLILLRIFDKHAFIYSIFQKGIEKAINAKIESVNTGRALSDAFIDKTHIINDYALFKSFISSVIDELTHNLELHIPSEENPEPSILGGSQHIHTTQTHNQKHTHNKTQKHTHNKTSNKTNNKTKKTGWFW